MNTTDTYEFQPGEKERLAQLVREAIDDFSAEHFEEGHRSHLGASVIGGPCYAEMWYGFRWVKTFKYINKKTGEDETGRMRRLTNRGHKEEERFVKWLRGIGVEVHEFQADGKTQFRVSGCNGHFGGSLDGMCQIPSRFGNYPPFLLEFKTSSSKYFPDLVKKGVREAKPGHYSQMSTYGKHYGLRYALYMCVNKDTDEIHVEIVELDWNLADQLIVVAHNIIYSRTRPPKISNSPSYQYCKYLCKVPDICHFGAPVEKNCRSCVHAVPVDNGQWYCENFAGVIPKEFIPQGCNQHKGVV